MGVKVQRPGDPGHPGGTRRIYVRVNHGGHRKTRIFNSAKAAEAYAAQVEAWLKVGEVDKAFAKPPAPVPTLTFQDAAARWLALEQGRLKAATLREYGSLLRHHLLPTFGTRPLADISAQAIEEWWRERLAMGLSPQRLTNIRAVANAIFARAVASGLAERNPIAVIMRTVRLQRTKDPDWLTEGELTALLAAADRHEPKFAVLLRLLGTAGLRLGEVIGLQVGDLDLARGRLYVRRGIREGRQDTPKSRRFRVVEIPPSTVAALRAWLPVAKAEAALHGQSPSWLFPNAVNGGPPDAVAIRAALERAAKAAGIVRHITPHVLRHTYASLAIQRGVPLLVVSRQLGHATLAITADVYGHLAPEAGRQAADAFEAILAERTAARENDPADPASEGKTRNPRATEPAESS